MSIGFFHVSPRHVTVRIAHAPSGGWEGRGGREKRSHRDSERERETRERERCESIRKRDSPDTLLSELNKSFRITCVQMYTESVRGRERARKRERARARARDNEREREQEQEGARERKSTRRSCNEVIILRVPISSTSFNFEVRFYLYESAGLGLSC